VRIKVRVRGQGQGMGVDQIQHEVQTLARSQHSEMPVSGRDTFDVPFYGGRPSRRSAP